MAPLNHEDLKSPRGRRRAWRELMLADHGFLRKIYDNTHEIAPGKMWRTYQPSPAKLRQWKVRGIKTVINLRGDYPSGYYLLEAETCAAVGLELETFRVFSREAPSVETLHGARDLFDRIAYPAIMHCKSGADRAGLMATLYLFLHENKPLDEALNQLSLKYGHVRQGKTGVIDSAFGQYIDYANAHGKSLGSTDDFFEWAQTHYDPKKTKENFRAAGWGSFLTEVVLRRE